MAATEHPVVSPSPTAEDTSRPTTLATTDIVVLVIYFLLVLAVGLWVSLLKSQNAQLDRDKTLYNKCLQASGSCSLCNITHIVAEFYNSKCVTYHIYGLTSCIWHIYNLCSLNSPCGRPRGAQWMDTSLLAKT